MNNQFQFQHVQVFMFSITGDSFTRLGLSIPLLMPVEFTFNSFPAVVFQNVVHELGTKNKFQANGD